MNKQVSGIWQPIAQKLEKQREKAKGRKGGKRGEQISCSLRGTARQKMSCVRHR